MPFKHPEICKPRSGIHYFNDNYDKDKKWYFENITKDCPTIMKHMKYGEFSTTYSYPENVPNVVRRLKNDFPNIKIIANIRHPIARIQSDYLRSIQKNEIKKVGLQKACLMDPGFINRGFYASTIEAFQKAFGADKVLIVMYDDIQNAPFNVLESVYSFIGVDKLYKPDGASDKVGSTYSPRIPAFEYAIQKMGRKFFNQSRLKPLKVMCHNFANLMRRLNVQEASIDDNYSKCLMDIYRTDIEKTQKLTGLDLSKWLQE